MSPEERAQASKDAFTNNRKAAIEMMKALRERIRLRDRMAAENPQANTSLEYIKLSAQIRQSLRKCKEIVLNLSGEVARGEKKFAKMSDKQKKIHISKKEMLDLVKENYEFVVKLDKERFEAKSSADRDELLAGGAEALAARRAQQAPVSAPRTGGSAGGPAGSSTGGGVGGGDDINIVAGSDKYDAQWQEMMKKDQEFESIYLDKIEENVHSLRDMAMGFSRELDKQAVLLSGIETKVDKQQAKLDEVNAKVAKAESQLNGSSRWCLNLILIVIIVAVAGYVWYRVSGHSFG